MTRLAKQLTISLTASAIASVLATLLGGRLLRSATGAGTTTEGDEATRPQPVNVNVTVIVMPVAVGNVMAAGAPGMLRFLLRRRRGWKKGKRH